MQHFGIIAHPVAHSLSPLMYEAGFAACHLDADFLKFDVAPEELETFLTNMRDGTIQGTIDLQGRIDLQGGSVSLPHKQTCIPFLDLVDPVAEEIGAVNTIARMIDSTTGKARLTGYNTDHIGVRSVLDTALVQNRKRLMTFKWKRVLLVGAGGMAAATAYVLRDLGAHVFIWNRTIEKAQALAAKFGGEVIAGDPAEGNDPYDMVIQTTSVGLESDVSPLPIHFWENHGNGIAIDTIYGSHGTIGSHMTHFLRDAERAGWETYSGEGVLVAQGMAQFQLLTGKTIDSKIFSEAISEKFLGNFRKLS